MEKNNTLGKLNINSSLYLTRISDKFKNRKSYTPDDPRKILSFIPGTVLDIKIAEGQIVKKGDELMILEAMKMKNKLKSSMDGKVKTILVKAGDKVPKGILLVELE